MYEKFGQFIDGKWQQSEKKETYEVINPATEEVLGHVSKAAQTAADAVGAKMLSYTGLRGAYDFFVIAEGTFEQAAGIKMATEASGTLCNITICEAISINDVAVNAAKIAGSYKGPGQ